MLTIAQFDGPFDTIMLLSGRLHSQTIENKRIIKLPHVERNVGLSLMFVSLHFEANFQSLSSRIIV